MKDYYLSPSGPKLQGPVYWIQPVQIDDDFGGSFLLFAKPENGDPIRLSRAGLAVLRCPIDATTGKPKPWRFVNFINLDGSDWPASRGSIVRIGESEGDVPPDMGGERLQTERNVAIWKFRVAGATFLQAGEQVFTDPTAPPVDGEYAQRLDARGNLRVGRTRRTRTVNLTQAQASNGQTATLLVDDLDELLCAIRNSGIANIQVFIDVLADDGVTWVQYASAGAGIPAGTSALLSSSGNGPFGDKIRVRWTITAGGVVNFVAKGK